MGRRRKEWDVVTGVEIGTAAVKVVIGEVQESGVVKLLGAGERPTLETVMKGVVVDVAAVQGPFHDALLDAEMEADELAQNIYLAVTGNHVAAAPSIGSAVVNAQEPHVSESDREAALAVAWSYKLKDDREPLHQIIRQFTVDGQEVENPVGQYGSRVEADCLIIHGNAARMQTLRGLIQDTFSSDEQEPKGLVFSGLAAGLGVLERDETEKGALVIDLGAGVTEFALFQGDDRCLFAGQVAVGCEHLANDLQLCLKLPLRRCRDLVRDPDLRAIMTDDDAARLAEIDVGSGKPVRRVPMSLVEKIVQLRLEELFTGIRDDLVAAGMLGRIGFGIKLTGGGAQIPQATELARQVFECPVVVGLPRQAIGRREICGSPRFATPFGLLRYGRLHLAQTAANGRGPLQQIAADANTLLDLLGRRKFKKIFKAFNW
ncbi:MAG: cell division protein FtsA [Lentisphaeria bacterium]